MKTSCQVAWPWKTYAVLKLGMLTEFLWVSCFLTIGYVLGDDRRGLVADLHRHLLVACLVVVAMAGGYTYWKVRRR